jgi:hypothetical protein
MGTCGKRQSKFYQLSIPGDAHRCSLAQPVARIRQNGTKGKILEVLIDEPDLL